MLQQHDLIAKGSIQKQLRNFVRAGSIDVNIMSKLDKQNYSKNW